MGMPSNRQLGKIRDAEFCSNLQTNKVYHIQLESDRWKHCIIV